MKLVIHRDDSIKIYRLALVYRQSSNEIPRLVRYNFKKKDIVVLPFFAYRLRENFDMFVDSVSLSDSWLLHD